ncbi:hypothetical protein ACFWBI_09030 [Streptomyces sp. NPDC059982]|uniref:hypothetical protein n=1 Tax=unclassified Streptomyces TaxID=2593676 RepID=UPI0036A9644D
MNTLAAAAFGQFSTTALTGAGLAVGLSLLAVDHYTWWKGSGGGAAAAGGGASAKDIKALIPTWFGIAYGVLMVGCPAGALGIISGMLRWGGNTFGGFVMSAFTGQTAPTVASASAPTLTWEGALVVTALTLTLWALRKKFPQETRRKFKRGVWIGSLLTIGTGVFVYLGTLVVPTVNELGAQLLGSVVNGTFL